MTGGDVIFDTICGDIHVTVYNNCLQDGPESSGKTTLARMLSEIIGEDLKVFSMNSAMDTTDLLGGFEQVSLTKSHNNQ